MKKLTKIALIGAVAAGSLTMATGASAASPRPASERSVWLCSHQAEITDQLQRAADLVKDRLALVTAHRDEAKAAGHDKQVAVLERRIERLSKVSARIAERTAKVNEAIANNCTAG